MVFVAKGKNLDVYEPEGKPSAELVNKMLGPTGNLRAPTIVVGDVLLVGFNEETFSNLFR